MHFTGIKSLALDSVVGKTKKVLSLHGGFGSGNRSFVEIVPANKNKFSMS